MKNLIFLLFLFLLSCGTSNKAITTTETRVNDTLTQIVTTNPCPELTRQERKALKDSMNHVQAMEKLKVKELNDSLDFLRKDNRNLRRNENKSNRIDRGIKKDSSKFEIQKLKQENKELKLNNKKEIDSLNAENKRLKIEGKADKDLLKQQGKNEKRSVKWWVWLIIVVLILSLLLNVVLLIVRR